MIKLKFNKNGIIDNYDEVMKDVPYEDIPNPIDLNVNIHLQRKTLALVNIKDAIHLFSYDKKCFYGVVLLVESLFYINGKTSLHYFIHDTIDSIEKQTNLMCGVIKDDNNTFLLKEKNNELS